jgi:hypothetical protein
MNTSLFEHLKDVDDYTHYNNTVLYNRDNYTKIIHVQFPYYYIGCDFNVIIIEKIKENINKSYKCVLCGLIATHTIRDNIGQYIDGACDNCYNLFDTDKIIKNTELPRIINFIDYKDYYNDKYLVLSNENAIILRKISNIQHYKYEYYLNIVPYFNINDVYSFQEEEYLKLMRNYIMRVSFNRMMLISFIIENNYDGYKDISNTVNKIFIEIVYKTCSIKYFSKVD